MIYSPSATIRHGIATAALALLFIWSVPGVVAGPSPATDYRAIAQDAPYTASIYAGECDALEPATALSGGNATPVSGSTAATSVYALESTVDIPITDLVSAPHAIAVESIEGDLAMMVGCGEIAAQDIDGAIVVGLTSTDSGGLAGVAIVREQAGDQVTLEIYLVLSAEGDTIGSGDDADSESDEDATDDGTDPDNEDEENPEGGV
jgi:hypothetical protein